MNNKFKYRYRHIDCIYDGENTNGIPHGFGKLYINTDNGPDLIYVGQWENGLMHGKGKLKCKCFFNPTSKTHTHIMLLPNIVDIFNLNKPQIGLPYSDTYYEGDFCKDRIKGLGRVYVVHNDDLEKIKVLNYFLEDETYDRYDYSMYLIYQGEVCNGKLNGYGEFIDYQNKNLIYKGNFKNSTFCGKGKIYLNGKIIIDGNFLNNCLQGPGKLFYPNGNVKLEGEFNEDALNGEGQEFDKNGCLVCKGHFFNGCLKDGYFFNPVKNFLFKNFKLLKKRM